MKNKKEAKQVSHHSAFFQNRRGQMKISFGMIFSIILIIVFISFAVYGITKFLGLNTNIQTNSLVKAIEDDVYDVWYPDSSANVERIYSVPNKITQICFISNQYGDKIDFRTEKGSEGTHEIEYINIEEPKGILCVDSVDGKVTIILKKEYGDALVTIAEAE